MGIFSSIGDAVSDFGSSIVEPFAPLISGGLSYIGGQDRNEAQLKSAKDQMKFQERMSNTAHQRQMADLKKAGLNPILAAKYGGASSPGGAQAQMQDVITPAINTGMQTMQLQAGVKKTQQEVRNLINDFDTANQTQWLMEAQKMLADKTVEEKQATIRIMKEEVEIKKKKAQISEVQYNLLKEAIEILAESFPKLGEILP